MKINATFILVLFFSIVINAQMPKIEYIAHASFVIESAKGTRVLIDPYHSYSQLGYIFPVDIKADLVLITHPHFDHDGSKYFSESTPIYRNAGSYAFNDVKIYGIRSNHVGWKDMQEKGLQSHNIIWVIETGGIKIVHLGDNDLLSPKEVKQISNADYIIGHSEDEYFNLFSSSKAIYIPNHYLLPEISKHKNWMEPVDGWLDGKKEVTRLNGNVFQFTLGKKTSKILVFKPSNKVKEWPQDYYDALTTIKEAFKEFSKSKNTDEVLLAMDTVISQSPYTIEGYLYKANFLSRMKKNIETIETLKRALVLVPNIDWATEIKVRKMLANVYEVMKQNELAYNQYLWLYNHNEITDSNTMKTAKQFIEQYKH